MSTSSGSKPPSAPAALAETPAHPLAGTAMILLTLAGWTSIPLFLTFFKNDMDFWTANGWRYGFSALMWLPVLVWGWWRRSTPAGLWRAALWPSLFNIGAQVCFGAAPYYVEPGLMTFCLRLQIVFLTIGAVLMFPAERRVITSPLYASGVALVVGGTLGVLLLKPGDLFASLAGASGPALVGVVLSIGSGLLYAGYALSVRKFMQGIHAFTAFSAVSQITGAALVVLMLVFAEGHGAVVFDLSTRKVVLLLLSAVIGIGIGHTLYYASIQRLGLAVSAGVVQLQPITVSVGSFFLFGERLTTAQWVTGVLAIVGAGLILLAQTRARARPEEA